MSVVIFFFSIVTCSSFRRWVKTSDELSSHVVSSKARRTEASKPTSTASHNPSIFSRISHIFSGSSGEATAEPSANAVPQGKSSKPRSYGFATKKLAFYTDKTSEDLYRYKNLSSDYMRSGSPTREENEEEDDASKTGPFSVAKKENDDKDPSK